MCVRPSPHNARRAASAKAAPNRFPEVNLSKTENTENSIELQARKLRRAYFFCVETAITIASLAFLGGPRA
jgi:hypothetical protein